MAGGALVPHVLPNGRTIMVPAIMAAPSSGGLAMPDVPKPNAPDMRVAGPGGIWGAPAPPPVSEMVEPLKKAAGWRDPATVAMPPPGTPTVANPTPEKPAPATVDPATLAEPEKKAPAPSSGGDSGEPWNPLVRQVFNEGGGGGGGGPRRTGRREETSVTAERLPGKELLPELQWSMGLAERPDLGMEVDPDAQQPTWGNADPVMRARKTSLERGAEGAGMAARAAYEQQANLERQRLNDEKAVLAQQSQALDQNLSQIAERRNRIAQLQETADKRMEEARSFEPRTRKEVWQEMGKPAQIMGVLAMALGGYAVGTGRAGRNMGMDMVNKLIDDAVDDDRNKAEKRLKLGQSAKNDYERALTLYGDPEAAALEAKQRKLASTMGMLQNQLASQSLDAMAKQRGEQLYAQAEQQYLQNAQQLYDQLNGVVVKESINYKPEMVGGGGGGMTTLQRLKNAAEAKKAFNTITGQESNPHQRSVEGDKLNDVNGAMEAVDAADAVERDLRALEAQNSDIDDPLSGPVDTAAKVIGTGGTSRRARQSLQANTGRLARGIQQGLGKSDNDARLADEMAVGDGSGASRLAAARTARAQGLARLQTAMAGMTPQQRQSFLEGLPPERRAMVQEAMTSVARPKRANSEQAVK